MHDIVKAVGNCSYNQLVEKIISCKQSDNSELAGEGECSLFTLPAFRPARLPLPSHSHLFSLTPVYLEAEEKKPSRAFSFKFYITCWSWPSSVFHVFTGRSGANTFRTKPQTKSKENQDVHVASRQMPYFHSSQFSYQLSVTSPLKIFAHSTLSFLRSCQLGRCQVNTSRPRWMMRLMWESHSFSIVFLHL